MTKLLCKCGCGESPKYPGAVFVHGHHLRLKAFQRKPREIAFKTCPQCRDRFQPPRGKLRTKFCSDVCARKNQTEQSTVLLKCVHCTAEFRIANHRASTRDIRHCSRACRQASDVVNYRKGIGTWSKIAEQIKKDRGEKCEDCGYAKQSRVLIVHHIDGVHGADNRPSNLRVLCPTCHAEHHLVLGNKRLGPTVRLRS